MNICHKDEYMDSLIGRKVTITFKDGTYETGILAYPDFNIGYMLKSSKGFAIRFFKSHVRCIKTLP